MIHPTFEEARTVYILSKGGRIPMHLNGWEAGWHARDAEIADLKRHLAERTALLEAAIKDDPLALDRYVQSKLEQDREIQARLWHSTGCLCEYCVINRADDQEEYESRKA